MLDTSVVVCIPWRSQPDREEAWEYVHRFWRATDYPVITADSQNDLPFHLSEARNNAVKGAQLSQTDHNPVIIVADADTVPELDVVKQAVEICREDGHVVYPFTEYRYLSSDYLLILNHGDPDVQISQLAPRSIKENSVGGLLVTNYWTYWNLGGMDDRFERRWGFEDNAFVAVADTLATVIRLPGVVYSFSHEVEGAGRDWSRLNPNYWRNELYQHCYGNQKLMRELIKR